MHDTEDPTQSSAATAAGTAADYSARATYARGWEDAIRQRDEVGIQLAAAQAVIARMQATLVEVRRCVRESGTTSLRGDLIVALGGLDTVPGDALPPTSPAGASAPASGSTLAASSATSSVSEVAGSRCAQSGTPGDVLARSRALLTQERDEWSAMAGDGPPTDTVKDRP